MNNPKISIIVAIAKNRAIGKNNQLLWHIPEDLKHFHEKTRGHAVVMGQRTYESLPVKPLSNRINIVLSSDPNYEAPGCIVVHTLDEAIQKAKTEESSFVTSSAKASKVKKTSEDRSHFAKAPRDREIFIMGGGSVYAQMINKADKLYLTIVEGEYDADVFFPDYSMFKKIVSEENHESSGYKYTFLELER